ncbi:hypothetical protein GGI13_002623, partial [Coemansia sp. RSA 455]
STVDNAASAHITGEAVKTSSATNTSEPPGNDPVGCSTAAKRKRATDILSQSDVEEAFRWKEWRPGSFDPYPNAKRGRRRQLLRNASLFNNMTRVPTQQRAHNAFRKRVAALVRHVGTNSGAVTGCLAGDRHPAARTQTVMSPAAPTPPASSQTAMPLVGTTPSGPSPTVAPPADTFTAAHTLTATSSVAPTTPAPSLVAAASTASTTTHTQTATSTADTTPVAPPQDIAIPEGSTTMPAPSLVAAVSTSSTAAPPQDAMPSADTTPPGPSQDTAPLAAPPPPGPSQTATSNTDTTTAALTQTAAPQLAQRTIGMDVDVPAPHAVPDLYPAGQGAIGVGIAHAAGQQQMPAAVDMDIEAPGEHTLVDNGPAVYDGMHVPAPQPANITFGMDVEAPGQHAVAKLHPAGQGAVVGDVVRAPVQEQVQGAPGMDVDQGTTTGGLAQEPAPQPANSALGMDVDATEQNAVAELDPVGRDTMRPFAHWVVARSARYATLRAYLRKQRQLDRAAPYHIPTREQRRRLRRKWVEANNAAAQQHQQSTLGASTAASTQHAAIDSEAVVGENPAGQGAIEDDAAHAPPQQQPGPGIANPAGPSASEDDTAHAPSLQQTGPGVVNTNFLPGATDGGQNDDGLPNYEHPDESSTSLYWVEQRRDRLPGPLATEYDLAVEGMFRALVNESLEDMRKGSERIDWLWELVEMDDDDVVVYYQAGHNETEPGYIHLPDEPAAGEEYDQEAPAYQNAGRADVEEYDPEAPAYGDAQVPAEDQFDMVAPAHGRAQNDADYSDAESETLTMDTSSDPSDDEDEQDQ